MAGVCSVGQLVFNVGMWCQLRHCLLLFVWCFFVVLDVGFFFFYIKVIKLGKTCVRCQRTTLNFFCLGEILDAAQLPSFFLLFLFFFPTLFKKKNIYRTYLEKSFQSTVSCEMLMKYQLWPALFFSIQDHSSNFPQKLMFDFSFLWQCLERKNPA